MANIVQNITEISNIISCDQTYYDSQSTTTDPYYETTIYLVETVDGYVDFYYGNRKLSDIIVTDTYPDLLEYPNDKIYLQPRYNNNEVYGYQVYFKHDNTVITLTTTGQYINVVSVGEGNEETWQLQFYLNGSTEPITRNIILTDSEGNLPSSIYEDLYNPLEEWVQENYVTPCWKVSSGGGSGMHNYSTDEQVVGKWTDGEDLYERTIFTNILSGRANAEALSTLLECTPDFVKLDTIEATDDTGAIYKPYSSDMTLQASSGSNYGDYCSDFVNYPKEALPPFDSLLATSYPQNFLIYNSLDQYFYLITLGWYNLNGINITNEKLVFTKSSSTSGQWNVYRCQSGDSAWTQIVSGRGAGSVEVCSVSQLNKFKFVYVNSTISPTYTDGSYTTTFGGSTPQYFSAVTGAYLNNDYSMGKNYTGNDYFNVRVDESGNLEIINGSNYPVLPMIVTSVIQYTKSTT